MMTVFSSFIDRLFFTKLGVVLGLSMLISANLGAQDAAAIAMLDSQKQRFKAQVERNTLALQTLLHDELYYLHSNGFAEDKPDFIQSVKTGSITYLDMFPVESRVKRFGKTGVITGLLAVRGLYKGTPFDIQLYFTSVYRKKGRHWQLINWQSTQKEDE